MAKEAKMKLVRDLALPFLLSVPPSVPEDMKAPVLCFLHGYMEGPPTEIYEGLTAHGPLRPGNSPVAAGDFVVVAPQLPMRGDLWWKYAEAVGEIVAYVEKNLAGDPDRVYLTGFSFGANGVFDLALRFPHLWAALWPVDPTRVPVSDPGLPVWLFSGEASRPNGQRFAERLRLQAPGEEPGNRIYLDEGLDHVGTATSAYRRADVYRWLVRWRRAGS